MQRFYLSGVEPLGDREIAVIAASSALARDGNVVEVRGMNLDNYKKVPIVLYQHNPTLPIGTCTAIGVEGDLLAAKIVDQQAATIALHLQWRLANVRSWIVAEVQAIQRQFAANHDDGPFDLYPAAVVVSNFDQTFAFGFDFLMVSGIKDLD